MLGGGSVDVSCAALTGTVSGTLADCGPSNQARFIDPPNPLILKCTRRESKASRRKANEILSRNGDP
jgi:hypothetical protein